MVCERDELHEYLSNINGSNAIDAVRCPFIQESGGGLGLGEPLFTLLVFGTIGLGMAVRLQHPGPLVVAGMLTVGAIALPGQATVIVWIIFFAMIMALGLYLYQRIDRTF